MPVPIVWGITACLGAAALKILFSKKMRVVIPPFEVETSQ